MQISVSLNGRKLFNWEGGAADVANIDDEMMQLAKSRNTTPKVVWHSVVKYIGEQGGLFAPNRELQMMVLLWGLMSEATRDPEHPGQFRDYIEEWDYGNFDIQPHETGFVVAGNGGRYIADVKGNA